MVHIRSFLKVIVPVLYHFFLRMDDKGLYRCTAPLSPTTPITHSHSHKLILLEEPENTNASVMITS